MVNYGINTQYLNGKQHGEQIDYFTNGKLRYKFQYLNGKQHGEQLGTIPMVN